MNNIQFTVEILNALRDASVHNSESLIEEAKILLSKKKFARSYFLACQSIEETGKAFLVFNSVKRNLKEE